MKKQIMIAAAALLTIGAASAAITWGGSVENLAKGATVTVSSNDSEKDRITDGDEGNRWQAVPKSHDYTQDWVILDLGEVKEFTDIEIKWESSHASSYDVYVSETAIPYTAGSFTADEKEITYNKISEDWLKENTPVAKGGNPENVGYVETLEFKNGAKGQYVLIYATDYCPNGKQYGISIHEVKLANLPTKGIPSTLTVTSAQAFKGIEAEVKVSALDIAGVEVEISKVSDLTLTSDASVEITAKGNGEFVVKGNSYGNHTLTATAKVGDETITGTSTFAVNYDWSTAENLVKPEMKVAARLTEEVAEDYAHTADKAIDGDAETYYQFDGNWGGGDSWVVVDLGKEYMIKAIGALFGNNKVGGSMMKVAYALELKDLPSANAVWNDAKGEGWTTSESVPRNATEDGITTATYIYPSAVKARYIAVADANNPGGKPQVYEIYADGEEVQESIATTIKVTSDKNYIHASHFEYVIDPKWDGVSGDPNKENHKVRCGWVKGEVANLTVTVFDQYDNAMEGYTANDFVLSVDNASHAVFDGMSFYVGKDKSEEAYQKLKENDWNFNTMDLYKGALGNYTITATLKSVKDDEQDLYGTCNVFAGAYGSAELSNGFKTAAKVEGASNNRTDLNGEIQFAIGTPVVINFDKEYDFCMIRLNWEAAAAGEYTIEVEDAAGNKRTIYELNGREFIGGQNPIDVILHSGLFESQMMRASALDTNGKADLTKIKKMTITINKGNSGWPPRLLSTNFYGVNTGGDITTVIDTIEESANDLVNVYNFSGVLLRNGVKRSEALQGLDKGLYIVGGKKVMK